MTKNLAHASSNEFNSFLSSFDNILFDCDGVLMLGDELIPGVSKTIASLRCLDKKMKLITNNSFRTVDDWDVILKHHQLGFTSDDVIYPIRAVISYLQGRRFDKKAFVLGHPAMVEELKNNGIETYDYDYSTKFQHITDVEELIKDDLSVGAVIVDLDFDLTYMKLMKAAMILQRNDVYFIVCATDKTAPLVKNLKVIGSYFIADTLEMISGRKPVILGKPGKMYNNYVQNFFNYEAGKTLFVGDSLLTDMLFASRCGYQKLLVMTGTTNHQARINCPEGFKPEWYLSSLGDLHNLICMM